MITSAAVEAFVFQTATPKKDIRADAKLARKGGIASKVREQPPAILPPLVHSTNFTNIFIENIQIMAKY